jgi:hypothetical protein
VSTLRVVSNIEYAKVFRSFNGMVPMTETTIIDVPNFAFSGNAERLHGSTWYASQATRSVDVKSLMRVHRDPIHEL